MKEFSIPKNEGNIFRDTPMRYMGYINEIGESFRYQVQSNYTYVADQPLPLQQLCVWPFIYRFYTVKNGKLATTKTDFYYCCAIQ